MTSTLRYMPNKAEIASKVLDGEAVIINLTNGTYYSSDQVGGAVWGMIENGHSLAEITAAVLAAYEVQEERLITDLEDFFQELRRENLLTEASGKEPIPAVPAGLPARKLHYEPPALNVYRDMADLMAIDPPMPGVEDTPWEDS